MHPGPSTNRLLCDQDEHRSQRVWDEGYASNNLLYCRRVEACVKRGHIYNTRMDRYLKEAGFYGVARLPFIQLDWALITALVERWRPETHTFHMRHGELTVTLEDVAVQLGLPTQGEAVIGKSALDWRALCERLLGCVPAASDISYGRLRMKWLADTFQGLDVNASEEVLQQYTRAYILQLIGGMVFPDKTQSRVHLMYLALLEDFDRAGGYSWGSACLAWLYRQLCRASHREATQIAGPLILLQIWAWDRFPHVAPRRRMFNFQEAMPLAIRWCVDFDVRAVGTHVLSQYREAFDRQTEDQIVWRPYNDEFLSKLPAYCLSGREIWHARVPLICFHVVEWHYPDRVRKQFGGTQSIPSDILGQKHKELHQIDLRGRNKDRWDHIHRDYVFEWNSRAHRLVPLQVIAKFNYSHWYETNSRPTISATGTMLRYLTSNLHKVQTRCDTRDPVEMYFISDEIRRCRELLDEHIAVRLHGRTDDNDQLPDSAGTVQSGKELPSIVMENPNLEEGSTSSVGNPLSATLRNKETSTQIVAPVVVPQRRTRGRARISAPVEDQLVSQITQVSQQQDQISMLVRPRRTKCTANRGRLAK